MREQTTSYFVVLHWDGINYSSKKLGNSFPKIIKVYLRQVQFWVEKAKTVSALTLHLQQRQMSCFIAYRPVWLPSMGKKFMAAVHLWLPSIITATCPGISSVKVLPRPIINVLLRKHFCTVRVNIKQNPRLSLDQIYFIKLVLCYLACTHIYQ